MLTRFLLASMGPRHLSRGILRGADARLSPTARRFNGATASEPWNLPAFCFDAGQPLHASMGPRHLSRGIDDGGDALFDPLLGFNGATASEPWNLRSQTGLWSARCTLQWGHGI